MKFDRKYTRALFLFTSWLALPLAATAGKVDTVKPESAGMSSARLARIDEYFRNRVEQKEMAGAQVLIARRGAVVMHDSWGVQNVATGVPVNPDTIFRVFSMTKPIMGVAMMMLYEEGLFSLADPISKFIPGFAELPVYGGEGADGLPVLEPMQRQPLLEDLFRHTAGLTYGVFGDTSVDRMYVDADLLDPRSSLPAMIGKLVSIPLLYQPGSRYEYSVSVDVQAYLLEQLTGMDVESYLRERIFEPLGMDETVAWAPPDIAARLSDIHTHDDDGTLRILTEALGTDLARHAYEKPGLFNGGGQLISSADDYFRFAQMLLNGGELEGVRLLAPSTVDMMTSNRLPATVEGREISPGVGHGINLRVVTDSTQVPFPANDGEFGHGGMASTYFWVDRAEELVVVVMSQYLPYQGRSLSDVLHRLVYASIIE